MKFINALTNSILIDVSNRYELKSYVSKLYIYIYKHGNETLAFNSTLCAM